MKKKKTYVLMVANHFPKSHPRAGEETHFKEKIYASLHPNLAAVGTAEHPIKYPIKFIRDLQPKLHTIRANYTLWSARAEKINRGEAVLSLRQWSGVPYRSKQEEFLRLDRICVQRIRLLNLPMIEFQTKMTHQIFGPIYLDKPIGWDVLAKNDGLSVQDMTSWFKIPNQQLMALIHFTEFKY